MNFDIFNNDAFSLSSLSARVDRLPFVPGQAGRLGIFDEEGIYTTTLEVEERNGTLALVPNTPRGAPPKENTRDSRKLRYFKTLHLPQHDRIMADEIQNKRQFGIDDELQTAQIEVDQRMMRMNKNNDATIEYGRIGALQGVILDADGATVLYNLFTEFGLTQTVIDYVLGTTTTNMLLKSVSVRDAIQVALGADGGEDLEIMAFCGATWFNRFVSQPTVAPAYQYYQSVQANMNPLQMDLRYKGFKFGDITYRVYRGIVNGIPFVPANQAVAFPIGAGMLDIYKTFYSPADYMETANTQGKSRYAKMAPDPSGFNKFMALEVQSNPLSMCLRPDVLIQLTSSN